MADATATREQLLHDDPHYRRLVQKHREFEEKLVDLQSRRFLTDDERLEEARLKKLKLRLKDEMEALVRQQAEAAERNG